MQPSPGVLRLLFGVAALAVGLRAPAQATTIRYTVTSICIDADALADVGLLLPTTRPVYERGMRGYARVAKSARRYSGSLVLVADEWRGLGTYSYQLPLAQAWAADYWPTHFGPTRSWADVRQHYATAGLPRTVDWYASYAAYLLLIQQSTGSFPGYWYLGDPLSTAYAVMMLEPPRPDTPRSGAVIAAFNRVNAASGLKRGADRDDFDRWAIAGDP